VLLHDLLDPVETDQTVEARGGLDVDIRSVEHDSRAVTPGALFCCIPGERNDGHDFAPAAEAAGAAACLVERFVAVTIPQVRVASVRRALGPLCARFHGDPSCALRVLGVTGTNGKTTITYLLERVAGAAGERAAILGTTGARVGGRELPMPHTTPEATDLQALLAGMRDAGARTVAMEVSSHALDQHRVDATRFTAVCFTNLSHDHLDYHGSLGAYFDAKARLFTREFTDRAAVCVDEDFGRALEMLARDNGLDVATYGLESAADVTADGIELGSDGTAFTMVLGGERRRVSTPLVGRFNVVNALGAATTAQLAGYTPDAIVRGLSGAIVVPGRLERVDAGQPFPVFVDYAHTPDALRAVLEAARPLVGPGGRLIVVFGCGGDRDRAKRPAMGAVAARAADVAILTSDNPRSEDPAAIARDVLAGVEGTAVHEVELDRRVAIRDALRAARAGDVVVIAGKGHETGQTRGGVTVPFDDRVVAREELGARP